MPEYIRPDRLKKPKATAPAWEWDRYYTILLRRGALEGVPAEYARRFALACLEDSALLAADRLVLLYGREYAQVEQFLARLRRMGMSQAQRYSELIRVYRRIVEREAVRIRDPYVVWKGVYTEWEIRQVMKDHQAIRREYERLTRRPWKKRARAGRPSNRVDCVA